MRIRCVNGVNTPDYLRACGFTNISVPKSIGKLPGKSLCSHMRQWRVGVVDALHCTPYRSATRRRYSTPDMFSATEHPRNHTVVGLLGSE